MQVVVLDEKGLVEFSETQRGIAELQERYGKLIVSGPEDKEGYRAAHEARMIVKGKRVEVEKRRKELKQASLDYGRRVDETAKKITNQLLPIETHLEAQEKTYEEAREKIRQEAELARKAKVQARIEALVALGVIPMLDQIEAMSEEAYQFILGQAQAAFAAKQEEEARLKAEQDAWRLEQERLAKEEADRKAAEAEAERKAKEEQEKWERLERERKAKEEEARLAKERADLEAERVKLEAERVAAAAAAALNFAVEQAALALERAKLEEERKLAEAQKAEAEAIRKKAEEEALAKARAEEAGRLAEQARIRAEAIRPEREKLLSVKDTVLLIGVPEVESPEAIQAANEIKKALGRVASEIESIVKEMN